jgi:hypothetical protein
MTFAITRAQAPAFPPIDDAIAALAAINWQAVATRALALALTVAAVAHALAVRLAPIVAAALRALADRIDRPAPAAPAAPAARQTVAELRAAARAAGLPRRLYTYGRRAELLAALAA